MANFKEGLRCGAHLDADMSQIGSSTETRSTYVNNVCLYFGCMEREKRRTDVEHLSGLCGGSEE